MKHPLPSFSQFALPSITVKPATAALSRWMEASELRRIMYVPQLCLEASGAILNEERSFLRYVRRVGASASEGMFGPSNFVANSGEHALSAVTIFSPGEATMWRLVELYTGRVGYRRGVKAEGLSADPPVIDCSGWVGVLLTQAMRAVNEAAGRTQFCADDVKALHVWSDRIIEEVETRTGFILAGSEITVLSLPRCATIGLKTEDSAWAANHPRPRGITHIVQVVRRPADDAPFVSQSFGGSTPPGLTLTPLAEWLALSQPRLSAGEVWAVDPFRLASNKTD
jgi:hypothetical protein